MHSAFASGKLILCGEHAVVHGHPALAFAVSLGTTVRLVPHDGPTGVIGGAADSTLQHALITALGEHGWQVQIDSTLPMGRGMGSSAALATALVRARALAQGEFLSREAQFDAAMGLELIFHANPSGVDVAVSVRGGVLRYQRDAQGEPQVSALTCPDWQVVVLDTGVAGHTARLVAEVSARRPGIDPYLHRIGMLVEQAAQHLHDPAVLGPILNENQAMLDQIGVSTPEVDALVSLARGHGALGAKLSGAGGGGVVMALVHDPAPLLDAAASAGVPAWACRPAPATS